MKERYMGLGLPGSAECGVDSLDVVVGSMVVVGEAVVTVVVSGPTVQTTKYL